MNQQERPEDGRKYHVGDEVDFTDDDGQVVPGVVHAVRYQQGHYEWSGAMRPDMHSPEGPDNLPLPGTGEMVLVPGTENERHSFEYIMVHKHEHKAWWETKARNELKHKKNLELMSKYQEALKKAKPGENDNIPLPPERGALEAHPQLKQHIRVFEEDA